MPDSLNRPLTLPEKFRALTDFAESGMDLADLRSRVSYLLLDIDLAIERKRPGYMFDQITRSSKETARG